GLDEADRRAENGRTEEKIAATCHIDGQHAVGGDDVPANHRGAGGAGLEDFALTQGQFGAIGDGEIDGVAGSLEGDGQAGGRVGGVVRVGEDARIGRERLGGEDDVSVEQPASVEDLVAEHQVRAELREGEAGGK